MKLEETLLQIKQLSNEEHIRALAHNAIKNHNDPFKEAIYKIASVRFKDVDDYIRVAKQAIDDYEKSK